MHDLRLLREPMDELRAGLERRGVLQGLENTLSRAAALESERRSLIQQVEERKAERNSNSQEVARRKRSGEDASDLVGRGRLLGDDISRFESRLREVETEVETILLELPNLTDEGVPAGGESENRVLRSWGEPRAAGGIAPHWETGERLGLLDLARGAKISGSGFVVFRGRGARLVRGLINFMLELHADEHGYEEVWVPTLVTRAAMTGTSQLPKFEDDMYAVDGGDQFLIPTAEVPVTNLYREEMLEASMLPAAFCAYTPCFRREAGAAGKDTRGLLRVHQFDKVELVRYAEPEESAAEHDRLTTHAETVLRRLELPYRVLLLAAGDTGFASTRTYDLEVFAPGVGKWLEVSSSSNFGDFQARRANIRYRPAGGGKPRFIHTLNASGLALPRIIAALLEHGLQPDGSVLLPESLHRHVGLDRLA